MQSRHGRQLNQMDRPSPRTPPQLRTKSKKGPRTLGRRLRQSPRLRAANNVPRPRLHLPLVLQTRLVVALAFMPALLGFPAAHAFRREAFFASPSSIIGFSPAKSALPSVF